MGQLVSKAESMYGSRDEDEKEETLESYVYGSGIESMNGSDMGSTSSKGSQIEEKDKPIIMVLGGPGTGKGTQCSRMVKEFGFKHISLGDILREEVKQGTPVGQECSKIMKEGKLVPVNLTLELMRKAMAESRDASGYILDGFPRATSQARAFQKQMKAPSLVLYLHAPENVLLKRLLSRGETSGRADDNVDTIRKRFDTFKKESLPVVAYYENKSTSVVKKVCTIKPPDDVYKQIRSAIKTVISSTTHLRKHMRRRRMYKKEPEEEPEEEHVTRVARRRRKKKRGHPYQRPPPPPEPEVCILM